MNGTGETQILCADNVGEHFVVSQDLWNSSRKTQPTTAVHGKSSTQEKISLFLSMFHGREDVYAKRYYNFKSQKSGYVPACQNEWAPGLCDKRNNRCIDCLNRSFIPLSPDIIRQPLIGYSSRSLS